VHEKYRVMHATDAGNCDVCLRGGLWCWTEHRNSSDESRLRNVTWR